MVYNTSLVPKGEPLGVPITSAPDAPTLGHLPGSTSNVTEFVGLKSLEIGSLPGEWPPLLKLPIEIFRTIILYVLDDIGRHQYYTILLQLRLVSRKWVEAIDDYPKLWVKLYLDGREELVDMALSKSRGQALDVECYDESPSTAQKAEAEAHRWRSLKLGTPGDLPTFSSLLSQPAPLLEELDVTPPHGHSLSIPLLDGEVSNIRAIKISRCHLPWGSPSLSNLQKLSIDRIEEDCPTISTLFDILRRSPNLTHLEISECSIRLSPPSPPQPVKLPRLQTLILSGLSSDIMGQLLGFMEVPPGISYALHVWSVDSIPLENQLAHTSKLLGALERISDNVDPILSLTTWGGPFRGYPDLNVELRFFTPEASNTDLFLRVTAPPRWHSDIMKLLLGQLRLSNRSWSPQLHLINMVADYRIAEAIDLLGAIYEALPNVRNLTFTDASRSIEGIPKVLHQLFPQDSTSSRLFPHLRELTCQMSSLDRWANSIVALSTALDQSGGIGRLPLETVRLKGGLISGARKNLLEAVVPTLILDNVVVE